MARTPIMIACISILFQVCLHVVQAVSTVEGEGVDLTFPYPCNSSQVTLQQSTNSPFYRSTDGLSLSLTQDQVQRFNVQNKIDTGTCSLALTITDLRRADQGTYILFVYKDGNILGDDIQRVNLQVDYPAGKASCVVGDSKGGEWVEVDCTANAGTIPGKIECYQNGLWMPPLSDPTVVDSLLKQTILILKSQPAFCCTSPWQEYRERCECNDTALFLDGTTSEKQCSTIEVSTTTQELTNNVTSEPTSITTTSMKDTKGHCISKHMIITTLFLAIFIIIIIIITYIVIHLICRQRHCTYMDKNTMRSSRPPIKDDDIDVKIQEIEFSV
ncbi:uncharacterized protein LOC121421299 [Lytechinus variegatus]|uniref:uncharacterized protein LOC121421299 n=1 Tax=Lytechinus variegatus TaxID=7654 RepID=UPI001BB19EE2|nr:uncharacterized protein LOC121421299 [Lytechinus variegatus]